MKRFTITVLLFCGVFQHLVAQENTYGIQIATSYSKLKQTSEFEIITLHGESNIFGLNLGTFYNLNFSKFQIRNSIDLQEKLYLHKTQDIGADINGNKIGIYLQQRQHNISTIISSIFTYSFGEKVSGGLGLSTNILIFSWQKSQGTTVNGTETDVKLIRNYKYRPISLSIPLVIARNWEYSNLYFKFSFDISNRLPNKSFITETENMIQIGYGIVINRD